MTNRWKSIGLAALLAGLTLSASYAEAAGVLTIGRREDSTTFDPIKTAQNIDNWVFSNVYDVLIRVDKTGTKLEPGLAESWTTSDDGLTYTLKIRDTKFSDGSPLTAEDAAYSLLRIRDDPASLWSDSYKVIDTAVATDAHTLTIKLKNQSAPFLSTLALPNASVISKKGMETLGADAYGEKPIASGAFVIDEWRRGDRVILKKNPNFWQADRVKLDGVEWISVPDDNTRMLNVQAGELDAALFVPFSRVEELKKDPNLNVDIDASTREDHLLINHAHGALGKKEVRQALDLAIDKTAIVDTVTFGQGTVANSYIPKGALYYYADNLQRPYDPAKAKELLAAAGASDLTLNYLVRAGDEVDEQTAVLVQQQLQKAGITANLQKVDPSQEWDMIVAGDYDVSVNYWTNDILDPDQKTTFVLGHDSNNNYSTNYKSEAVKELVAKARLELDPKKREQMYVDLQKMAKDDVNWIDLYYSPYINVSRKNIENFYQNPLGRFFLEDTVKN
ncbi:peptide/nickel transport system substrate-binding protein [Rhizobium leguminosarum]|uniref:Peptide/nickel transport system substrate-binding protein n=1 Tax=Rhizobium leguminosarum TaxID=384 RepID=A0AAE2SZK9_RHILE|nr:MULTISPECIES: ABC transporter substrate-binding protein [Rhizobium]MBB4293500.1 peptide/nickel transport system substrate-binding protein [Rhizobium leguminosarum]MBB4300357.1 peptide/nickel transport system substrate-binding protein [Rhizobium leguminosarum]MBB4311628.1 peptide/nickel transport system substrate-binding protein [Rhizobium leguminosarum]MBB4420443.1 peptide/nickel transport system substrate-binding protein [Rhizobium leguminosarum]MBB4435782.1 peptide/nickel transport system